MRRKILYERGAVPQYTGSSMRRPKVEAMLLEAIEKPLTVVVASAGFGKTQAVSTLYENSDTHIIWIQLTELDNITIRCWERIIYAVGHYSGDLADALQELGFPDSVSSFNRFLQLLADALSRIKTHYIVVFDDFHVLRDTQLCDAIRRIVSANLNRLSIVLISNTEPPMNLADFYEKGMLSRITQEDLKLTPAQIADFLATQDIPADEHLAVEIYERTGGWVFAVSLLALSLKKGTYSKNSVFSEEHLNIYGLIEGEIYEPMPPGHREFLLKASLLGDIPLGLMRTLLAESGYTVQDILQPYGSLMRLDPSTDRYHIMNLFKAFMVERKNALDEGELKEFYGNAAQWYDENGYLGESIKYFKWCGNYLRIFEIILNQSSRCSKQTAGLFIELIDQAPKEAIEENPIILVARAKFLLNNSLVRESYDALIELRDKYEAMQDSPASRAVLGEVYIMFGVMSLVLKTLKFVDYFKTADQLLPAGSKIFDKKMALVAGANFFTIRELGPGSAKKMMSAFFEAMPYAVRVMNGCAAGLDYLVGAEYAYSTGDIKSAEKNAYAAIYQAKQHMQHDIEFMANTILLRIALYQGSYTQAALILQTVNKHIKKITLPDCISLCQTIESDFYARIERSDMVAKWIMNEDEDDARALAPISMNRGQSTRALCYLSEGRYYELLAYLDLLDEEYKRRYVLFGLIQNAALRAVAHHYIGEHSKAIKALETSYSYCSENGIIIFHVELGKRMRTLIRAARKEKNCSIPVDWLDAVYSKASTYAKRLAIVTDAYNASAEDSKEREVKLSKREIDVLTGLYQGLTRDQIAESYQLSVNTVKRMLPNIYRKLGAVNGMDAIRIAASRKLIG